MFVLAFLLPLLSVAQEINENYDSNFSLDLAEYFVGLAGASYCTDKLTPYNQINDWSCNACKNYPNFTATVFHSSLGDTNGFVGYDADEDLIVVAYSGTDPLKIQNWIDDLEYMPVDYPYCDGCLVHQGFLDSMNSVKETVNSLVNSLFSLHPTASLAITGHSLGAALAGLYTAEVAVSNIKFSSSSSYSTSSSSSGLSGFIPLKTSYTYGMPRVGNDAFQLWFKSSASGVPGCFRTVHLRDPVPHLPFQFMGPRVEFKHFAYEAFYEDDYEKKLKVCSFDGEDPSCADQYDLFRVGETLQLNYLTAYNF